MEIPMIIYDKDTNEAFCEMVDKKQDDVVMYIQTIETLKEDKE